MPKHLSITKRGGDCYDVWDTKQRIAALRAEFTEENGVRTAVPRTWRIRWEIPGHHAEFKLFDQYEAFSYVCRTILD